MCKRKSPPPLRERLNTMKDCVKIVKIKSGNADYNEEIEYARKIIETHLPLHDYDVLDTVYSILKEYALSPEREVLFTGVAGMMLNH